MRVWVVLLPQSGCIYEREYESDSIFSTQARLCRAIKVDVSMIETLAAEEAQF